LTAEERGKGQARREDRARPRPQAGVFVRLRSEGTNGLAVRQTERRRGHQLEASVLGAEDVVRERRSTAPQRTPRPCCAAPRQPTFERGYDAFENCCLTLVNIVESRASGVKRRRMPMLTTVATVDTTGGAVI
jgi:hypothetical protein